MAQPGENGAVRVMTTGKGSGADAVEGGIGAVEAGAARLAIGVAAHCA
jgi:hypothetical protein